ncbi:MAG: OmpH family outer membrane protein [Deltaproteobacteria bacterium]
MLKKFLFGLFFTVMAFGINSQSIAIVDVSAILENMEDYKNAQKELDKISEQYRQKVIIEQDKVKAMYNEYEAESVLMTEEMKKKKEDQIVAKEKEIREMQRGYFGPEGELFQKRQELVQPIENKVYAAITEYTQEKGIELVFDKGSNQGIIFVADKYNKTADIKKKLGIK